MSQPVISRRASTHASAYPRADGGGAHVDGEEIGGGLVEMLDLILEDGGEAVERLAERHGHGVLELGTADLEDLGKLLAFLAESGDEGAEIRDKLEVGEIHAHVDCRGIRVVGRLLGVDMIVGRAILIFPALVAHELESPVGNHLVGVHVGRRAGSALNHVDGELVEVLAVHDLAACLLDGLCLLVGEKAHLVVGAGRAHFGYGETLYEKRKIIEMESADLEILYATKGLDAIEGAFRHFDSAQKVGLLAESLVTTIFHDKILVEIFLKGIRVRLHGMN